MIKSIALSAIRPTSQTRFSFFKMISLARQRSALAQLDDHILADIGVTREQALSEADRPVWDAPNHWTR